MTTKSKKIVTKPKHDLSTYEVVAEMAADMEHTLRNLMNQVHMMKSILKGTHENEVTSMKNVDRARSILKKLQKVVL